MSEILQGNRDEGTLPSRQNVPVVQVINGRPIEITYLGQGLNGAATWLLWNPNQPNHIGLVRQSKIGYSLEHRTRNGVELLENVPLRRVQLAITTDPRPVRRPTPPR